MSRELYHRRRRRPVPFTLASSVLNLDRGGDCRRVPAGNARPLTEPRRDHLLDWFWLAFLAYWIGQIITLLELKSEHPDWRLLPCAVMGMAWPYLVIVRCIAFWRTLRRR
jgi:hypothetical protein